MQHINEVGKKIIKKAMRRKSEEYSVKKMTKRKAQKKTAVSKTDPPQPRWIIDAAQK